MKKFENRYFEIPAGRDSSVMIPVGVTLPEKPLEGEKVPVVILQHGYLGNKDEWGFYYGATVEERGFDSIAKRLAEVGIGTIRVDMPGSGDSKDDFRNYVLDKCRSDLKDAFEYCMKEFPFDKDRIGFLGWSMGAKIGTTFLLEYKEISPSVFLNPAGDNGGRSIMNAAAAGLDYSGMMATALKEGEAMNEAAAEVFGHDFYVTKDFFDQVEASKTGDEIRQYIDEGRKGLLIYGDSDSTISPQTYEWLRQNSGIPNICIQDMDHDMGLESGRPDYTNTVIDIVTAYFNCYL